MNLSIGVSAPLPPTPSSSVALSAAAPAAAPDIADAAENEAAAPPDSCVAPSAGAPPFERIAGSLSGFAREAIREKAARELAALRASLDAFAHLLSVQASLATASGDLTALLGGLSAIAADSGTIARAKKLRKLLDEARDAADGLVEATAVEQRQADAEEKRRMLLGELHQAGVTLDEAC